MEKKTIYLLLFHGSARPEAFSSANAFTDKLKKGSRSEIRCCFLRGQKPGLEQAIRDAVNDGYVAIKAIQLFLLPGAHVNEDIPGIVDRYKKEHPEISIELFPCLVELEEFAQMIQQLINK